MKVDRRTKAYRAAMQERVQEVIRRNEAERRRIASLGDPGDVELLESVDAWLDDVGDGKVARGDFASDARLMELMRRAGTEALVIERDGRTLVVTLTWGQPWVAESPRVVKVPTAGNRRRAARAKATATA